MSFANHNILDIALSIIPPTVVQIRKDLGTQTNAFGQVQASYSEWRDVYGIVEPGSETNEHTQGIDFSKKHVTIWLRGVDLTGTHIQDAPDQIKYVGAIYNVVGVEDWFPYDNYRKCDCVAATNLAGADLDDSKRSTSLVDSAPKRTTPAWKKKSSPTPQPQEETGPAPARDAAPEPTAPAQEEPPMSTPTPPPAPASSKPPKPMVVNVSKIKSAAHNSF